jgi:hypothetical protein
MHGRSGGSNYMVLGVREYMQEATPDHAGVMELIAGKGLELI